MNLLSPADPKERQTTLTNVQTPWFLPKNFRVVIKQQAQLQEE